MAPNLDRDEKNGEINQGFDEDVSDKKEMSSNSSVSSLSHEIVDGKKKKKKKEKPPPPEIPPVPFFKLFRFASNTDVLLGVFAAIASIGTGIMFPLMLILFGDITNAFVGGGMSQETITEINCNISIDPNYTYPIPP